jgi:uncharacterized protein involved in outer membrane biogenesis
MRILRWIGITAAVLLGIPIAALAVVVMLGVPISLDAFRANIEAVAGEALGRVVEIEGSLTLLPALRPTLEVRGLRIANPSGWDSENFLRLHRAHGTVDLLPLLSREISIHEIAIEGVDVRLETREDGISNWVFEPQASEASTDPTGGPSYGFLRLGELAIRSLKIDFRDAESSETVTFEVVTASGSVGRDERLELSARGHARGQAFEVSVAGGSLAALKDATQPWPLNVTADLAGTIVSVNGGITDPLKAQDVDLDIAISGEKREALEALMETSLPAVGPYDVRARLVKSGTGYKVANLEGSVGNTTFSGNIAVDHLATRPQISATLDVATLDLEPFLNNVPGSSMEREQEAQATPPGFSLDETMHSLDALWKIDADVMLAVNRVVGAPTDIQGASLKAMVGDGQLTIPVGATVSGVPINGRLAIQEDDDSLDFTLALSSEGSDMRNLTRVMGRTEGLEGSFEKFALRASGRGRNLRTALESLDLLMTLDRADLSYGRDSDEPVPLILETFELALPQGEALRLSTRGMLVDEAFSVDLSSATVSEALSTVGWPIDLTATGSGARLSLKGSVPELGKLEGTTLDLAMGGERIGDLAAWIGADPSAHVAYGVSGRLSFQDDKAYFESVRAKLGQTALRGDLSAGWRNQDLLLRATVRSPEIVLDELTAVFAQQKKPTDQDKSPGLDLHIPILPHGIKIADTDLDIAVERVRLQTVDLTDLSFIGRIREGRLKKSPFTATVGVVPFTGGVSLDLRSQVPVATIDIGSENVDVGGLLRELELVERSETRARRLVVEIVLRGSTLKTIIEKSEITAVLEDGVMTIRDPNTQAPLEIGIVKSTLTSTPGSPVVYDVDGRIGSVPVRIRIETNPLASFLEATDHVPLRLTADTGGLHVELNGSVPRPFTLRNLRFDLSVEGGNLEKFDELLHVSVPPWGPYALDGTVQLNRAGYHVPSLSIRVGDSHLTGNVSLDTTGTRPRLAVNLTSKTLQLNDFNTGGWSAFEYDDSAGNIADREDRSRSISNKKVGVEALLRSESMRELDARLSIAVNEVLSGEDRLGNGQLVATLEDGRISLDPVRIEIPEGSADARFGFEVADGDVVARTEVNIEHLDYGVLARRIDPSDDAAGWLSLDLDLRSRSKTLDNMLNGATGRFDFAVWPKNMQADIFDLWAANLVVAILPRIDSGPGSRVNCVVGVFDMADGIMNPKTFLVDTTNVQVFGDGEVNFKSGQLDLELVPKAKRPTMFSLATPIRVSGSYSEFETGASAEEWIRTAGRFVTSIFAPIRRIFTTPIPADGEAECLAAMERVSE